MSSKLSNVIAQLSNLSPSELKSVKMAIDHLIGVPTDHSRAQQDEDEHGQMFYDQATITLEEKGLFCAPWSAFQKMNIYHNFRKKFPEVEAYTERKFKRINRRDRQRLYKIYTELLVEWMSNNPFIPMKIGVFFQNLNQIPSLIADAFPGYSEQGWLPLVLKIGSRDHGVPDEE